MTRTVCVFCSARHGVDPIHRAAADGFGRQLGSRGLGLVYGGGKVGLMGVLADAVLAAGGPVIGVIPGFLSQAEILHGGITEEIVVDSLFARKALMIERADAFVALPGGIGTLDEILEVIAWRQLGQLAKPIGFLNVAGYFDPWFALFEHMVACGFASQSDLDHLIVAQHAEDLIGRLQEAMA